MPSRTVTSSPSLRSAIKVALGGAALAALSALTPLGSSRDFGFGHTALAAPFRVGLVLDKGGKDDKSFNSAANLGATKAQQDFGVQIKIVEATDDNAIEPQLRNFARAKFDLILAIGFVQADALKKISAQFPEQKFAIVDAEVNSPNVRSLMFQEHEGSFLVGAIAGLTSKSGKVGFIGGMDIPLIRRFQLGYEAGAKHVNPKIQTVANYVGVTGEAWNNPPKGKELAVAQYGSGVDVIFGAAGASTMGVLDAAEEKKKFAIGVDSNQNWVKPGYVLTSMLKRVDVAVHETIKLAKEGKFTGGTVRFGLENQGVDFAMDKHNEKLIPADVLKKVNALKADILAGKIKVPDAYEKGNKK
jgi:basic membrane protein A